MTTLGAAKEAVARAAMARMVLVVNMSGVLWLEEVVEAVVEASDGGRRRSEGGERAFVGRSWCDVGRGGTLGSHPRNRRGRSAWSPVHARQDELRSD